MHGTRVHGARVPFKTPLEDSLNTAISMELELHELEFHNFFFLSFIWHNSILNQLSFRLKLDFIKIKFQNRGMNLNSFKTETYC